MNLFSKKRIKISSFIALNNLKVKTKKQELWQYM